MEKGREIEGRKGGEKGRGREKWSGERERNRGEKGRGEREGEREMEWRKGEK